MSTFIVLVLIAYLVLYSLLKVSELFVVGRLLRVVVDILPSARRRCRLVISVWSERPHVL